MHIDDLVGPKLVSKIAFDFVRPLVLQFDKHVSPTISVLGEMCVPNLNKFGREAWVWVGHKRFCCITSGPTFGSKSRSDFGGANL